MPLVPHPEPPADLQELQISLVASTQTWWRIHHTDAAPLAFGRAARNRFDTPDGTFGVVYVAGEHACAFIETFGQATGVRLVAMAELERNRSVSL